MENNFDQLKFTQEAAEGKRTYDKPVRMIDEDGEQYEMMPEEVQEAAQSGYKIASPEQALAKDEAKSAGLFGTAKVFLGQAIDEGFGGAPETYLELTQSPLERERRLALKAESPIANIAGGITGAGASLLTPFGPLALAEKMVLKGTGKALEYAASKGAGSIAKKILAKSAEQGVVGMGLRAAGKGIEVGAESLLQQLPNSAIEAALGDPESAAENLMIATGVGGVLGTGFKGISEISKKVGKTATGMMSKIYKVSEDEAIKVLDETPSSEVAESMMEKTGIIPPETPSGLDYYANIPESERSPEIRDAMKSLGINPENMTPAAFTDDRRLKSASGYLQQQPTLAGRNERVGIEEARKKTKNAANLFFENSDDLSKFNKGEQVKNILTTDSEAEVLASRMLYKQVDELDGAITIPKSIKKHIDDMADGIKSHGMKLDPASESEINTLSDLLKKQDTIGDLRQLEKDTKARIKEVLRNGTPNPRKMDFLSDKLNVISEALETTVEKLSPNPSESNAMIKAAKSGYKKTYDRVKPILQMLGKDKGINKMDDLLDRLNGIKAEDYTRLFSQDNVKQLITLAKSEPEIFQVLRTHRLNELASKTIDPVTSEMNLSKFKRELLNLSKEERLILFNKEKNFKDILTVMQSLPEILNTSKTAEYQSIASVMDLAKRVPMNAHDLALYHLMRKEKTQIKQAIKKVAQEEVLKETAKATLQGQKRIQQIPKVINETLQKNRGVIKSGLIRAMNANLTKVERQEKFKEISDSITEHYTHLEMTTEKLREHSEIMGSEGLSNAYTTKVMNGVQYLYNVMPKQTRVQNPFVKLPDYKPSQAEIDSFMTKVEIVKDPYKIIDLFQAGLVNSEHIDVVKQLYPSIFGQIQTSFIDSFTNGEQKNTSYGDRIRLALLLDVQTDGSLNPEKMQSLQSTFMIPQEKPKNAVKLNVSMASPVEKLSDIG